MRSTGVAHRTARLRQVIRGPPCDDWLILAPRAGLMKLKTPLGLGFVAFLHMDVRPVVHTLLGDFAGDGTDVHVFEGIP